MTLIRRVRATSLALLAYLSSFAPNLLLVGATSNSGLPFWLSLAFPLINYSGSELLCLFGSAKI